MTRILEKELKCPCCDLRFETQIAVSTNLCGSRGTDLRLRAIGFQPIWFQIHTCPHCGYSGGMADFEDAKLNRTLKRLIKQKITGYLQVQEQKYKLYIHGARGSQYQNVIKKWIFPGHRYEYAAKLAEWRGTPFWLTGWLYLKAAWCCEDYSRHDEEEIYRRKVIHFFEGAVEQREVNVEDLPTCYYLIAENYRRVGEQEKASVWYDRAITAGGENPELKWLTELAMTQKRAPEDLIDE